MISVTYLGLTLVPVHTEPRPYIVTERESRVLISV